MTTPTVRISDIGLYLRCPRRVYFDSQDKLARKHGPGEWTGKMVFLAYADDGCAPVQNYRDSLASGISQVSLP